MDEARRQILTLVARGELDPGEAADRLAELDTAPEPTPGTGPTSWPGQTPWPRPSSPQGPTSPPPRPTIPSVPTIPPNPGSEHSDEAEQLADDLSSDIPTDGQADSAPPALARVRIDASVRAVFVVGDPEVVGAVADGPHSAQWEGDTIFIGEEHGAESFQFDWSERALRRRGRDVLKARTLHVRMHPSLALEATVSAGSLTVRRVYGPITATVAAGSAKIDDFEGPITLAVSAGSVSARGRLTSGQSRIDCDAGSVSLLLARGSSVSIRARSDLGKISLPGGHSTDGRGWLLGGTSEAIVGGGQATLDVRVNMGGVSVNVDDAA